MLAIFSKLGIFINSYNMDSISTTPPAILDYSLPSPITDQGVSCHTMTTLGYCDTMFSPGTLSSPVLSDHMSSDSDSDSSDTGYVCTSLRCEYGYCGHKPASDKEVHEAECLYWCRKCTFYLCCECLDRGIHVRHRRLFEKRSKEEYDRLCPDSSI